LESKTQRLADPGAELLDRAQGVWERYGRIVLGVIGAVALAAVLGFFFLRSRGTAETQAASKLAEANTMFWQGQYDRAIDASKQVYQQYGSTPSGIDAHRLSADSHYWRGVLQNLPDEYKAAIGEYREFLSHVKTGALADAARRSLAYALESDHQDAEAAKFYDGLVGKFDRESSAEFLTAASRCYETLQKKPEAIQRLQRVIDEFGDTSYAASARVHVAELQTRS
jgi:tetratricopeptide (TPR) repeat protein